VWDDKVATDINAAMGRRVSLHYNEKVGLPTTCFGETRHWVTGITVVPEIPISPGVMVPVPPANGGSPAAVPAAPTPAPPPPPAPVAPAPAK
jgi:hypothetical protein